MDIGIPMLQVTFLNQKKNAQGREVYVENSSVKHTTHQRLPNLAEYITSMLHKS